MDAVQTIVDRSGALWTVEHRESERLHHIGGFLVTCDGESCLTLSARISDGDKARGREVLIDSLVSQRVARRGVQLWHPDDEIPAGS
jgi:hypothetical protein